MTAPDSLFPVKCRIKCRILLRHKVLTGLIFLVFQTASNDLLHTAVMYINTRTEFHFLIPHLFRKSGQHSGRPDFIITGNSVFLNCYSTALLSTLPVPSVPFSPPSTTSSTPSINVSPVSVTPFTTSSTTSLASLPISSRSPSPSTSV